MFLLDRYLSTVRIVSDKLENEIRWIKERSQQNYDTTNQRTDENLDVSNDQLFAVSLFQHLFTSTQVHEVTYEQLVVMLDEIESDARALGHGTPSHLTKMMRELKQSIEADGVEVPILSNEQETVVPDQQIEWTKDREIEKQASAETTPETRQLPPAVRHLPLQPLHSTPLPHKPGPEAEREQAAQQSSNPSLPSENEPFAHFYMSEEEHSLIAQYSQLLGGKAGLSLGETNDDQTAQSPAQIMAVLEMEQQQELEAIIQLLEAENR